ncbi:methyltransferase FkbM family [Hyphomicrobium denitrificans ATCC 51888]|uniref:Methyltransferase FkbM family n=1 Tax=Hyphomicrobium denitrificans (strain ATCC 51888 / DSM 1869 / NCIMB 11706 / TK 0415) TaxID=582899 RepID=D8JRP1_HYPDA|nr:FkbM family methyltransferase [Hyphomicrobium denitrificans]ADJ22270.1 methyltransferase FkbM family [Hyphomicrobium denitrificans ATCC 51888]
MLQQSIFGHGVRSLVKASLPSSLFRKARFLKRLSIYYRMETSDLIQRDMNAGVDCIFLNRSLRLRLPDDALAHNVFRSMAFEAEEWRSFLKLASGCRAFVDIGASGGFFSALFAASRPEAVQILSIEPDPPSRIVLANVRDRNMRANTEWIIDGRAVGSAEKAEFVSSGYGVARSLSPAGDAGTQRTAARNGRPFARIEVECATLQSICREHGVVPDLLKIDIEGMEWDLVRASLDWLAQRRPRMHLEVHPAFIRRQHRDPHVLLKNLEQIGYRSHDGAAWASAFKRANGDANFHLDLVAKV